MSKSSPVKTNRNHGGKEFKTFFHFIGKVSPVRKKDQVTDSWEDQPIYEESTTRSGKPMRRLQFNVETARSNELRVEMFGMEQPYAYPYSSEHKKAAKIKWDDRHDKTKYPDTTYHLILPEWDKAELYGAELTLGDDDKWVEVKGHYDPQEFTNDEGNTFKMVRRNIDSVQILDVDENGLAEYKIGRETHTYVCDFSSEDFKEVNYVNMQIGIKSTYQEENDDGTMGDTKVNAVLLTYGKDRSEPKDVELMVYQSEVEEGKKSLADAFSSLDELDFIEIVGMDHNRALYSWVDVEEELDDDDPFSDIDDSNKQIRKEMTTSGTRKGLEITGYIAGSLIRGFLTEEEIKPTIDTTDESPFDNSVTAGSVDDPFGEGELDPFA